MKKEERIYKLPYIPDKDLFRAVTFACKMIREDGYFNRAIEVASNYYDVEPSDVEKYVRIAQGNGQRISNRKEPRKYHYYVACYVEDYFSGNGYSSDHFDLEDYLERTELKAIKALNERNAKKQLDNIPEYPSRYRSYNFNNIWYLKEFDSEKEAKNWAANATNDDIESLLKELEDSQ